MDNNLAYWTSERFFSRLEFFLEKKNITLNQLSQVSETSLFSLYQARRRKSLPTFTSICCMCDALEIDIWEFFDVKEEHSLEMDIVMSQMPKLKKESQNILAQLAMLLP